LETDGIGAQEVLRNWDEIKKLEKKLGQKWGRSHIRQGSVGHLDSVSRAMPALSEAGEDWVEGGEGWVRLAGCSRGCGKAEGRVWRTRIRARSRGCKSSASEELGDLLFTVANLARHLEG
jgi:uncharacterized protein YabN with tetrapyrrole methylase and pyrophosphatase domain